MESKIIKFGLLHLKTQKLLVGEGGSYPDDESAGDMARGGYYTLELNENDDGCSWLVKTPEQAEFVRLNSTWHGSSSFDTPNHDFKPHELEVVNVEINVSPASSVKLKTYKEMVEEMFPKNSKEYKQYIMAWNEKTPYNYDSSFISTYEMITNKKFF